MINSTTALNFLNSKKITLIKYRPEFKIWEIHDNKGFLSSDFSLLKAIDKCINIFTFISPNINNHKQEKGDRWINIGDDGDGYWEKISSEDDNIIEYLKNKKQDIWNSDPNWYLGDFKSQSGVNVGRDLRLLI